MIEKNAQGIFEDIYSLDELDENTIAHCNDYLKTVPDLKGLPCNGRVVGFCWDIRKMDNISISHSAPVGYKTNWGGDSDCPRAVHSMLDWYGRVWIRYDYNYSTKNSVSHWGSDPFRDTLTYTGTGGFGDYDGPWSRVCFVYNNDRKNRKTKKPAYPEPMVYSWDYRFYDSDFPNLGMGQMFAKLASKPLDSHNYLWEDPETLAADREYIESFMQSQCVAPA